MSLELYTNILVLIDGTLLTEENRVTINRSANSIAQNTVAKGYAGESPGAGMVTITVDNCVPSKDFELDPGKYIFKNRKCQITLIAASRQLTTPGFIISDTLEHGVNAESKLEFQFRGSPAEWT